MIKIKNSIIVKNMKKIGNKTIISLQESQSIHNQYAEQMLVVINKLKDKLKKCKDDVERMRIEYEITSKERYREIFIERIASKNDVKQKV